MEEVYYNNACCCNCSLQEGVGWISAFEIVWGCINAIVGIVYLIKSKQDGSKSEWAQFGEKHHYSLLAVSFIHSAEFLLGILLMMASYRMKRPVCILWLIGIGIIALSEIICTIWDPFPLTTILISINLIRIYFVYIVWALSNEIRQYPEGAPVTKVKYVQAPMQGYPTSPMSATSTVMYSPVVMPGPAYGYGYGHPYGGYGYGHPYGGYGYGHPYGGYGYGPGYGDAALLGLGTGLVLGGAYGGYGCCDYGGGGFYDSVF